MNTGNKFLSLNDKNKNKILKTHCCTLQHLLDIHNVTKVDFFSLDVEGNELSVLKGIDFNKTIFDFILIESRNINKIDDYLIDKNYSRTKETI